MKFRHWKIFFLLLSSTVVASGCWTTQGSHLLTPKTRLEDVKNRSVVMGKISFEGIPGNFLEAEIQLVNDKTEKIYPIKAPKGVARPSTDPKKNKNDFYFFAQLPEGSYHIYQVIGKHKTFDPFEIFLLNANLTIPKNSLLYIGTIQVKGIGPILGLIGPVTESDIIDEHDEVIGVFRRDFPQFLDAPVRVQVIDRYELYKKGGVAEGFYFKID